MTDYGTTGFPVAPIAPTEDEMKQVQSILQRAVDAFVGMSQLQVDVKTLSEQVAALTQDVTNYRQTIANQDEMLTHIRGERDEAKQVAAANYDRATTAERNLNYANSQVDSQATELNTLRNQLAQASRERDDYGLQVMALEDTVKSLMAKLDAVHAGYRQIFGEAKPEAVQAAPTSTEPVQEQATSPFVEPKPEPKPWWASNEPTPATPEMLPIKRETNTTDRYLDNGDPNPDYVPF